MIGKKPIKVLYIAGPRRSGSTILSNILGGIDGFFNAGELISIWDRGLLSSGLCSCGERVKGCKVWKSVVQKAFVDFDRNDILEMIKIRDSTAHSRNVPKLLFKYRSQPKIEPQLNKYLNNLNKLYMAIQSTTNSDVIVDSSKNVGYAFCLSMLPGIDIYILHFIRDSRAIAYSWMSKKDYLWRDNPLKVSLIWNIRNTMLEIMKNRFPGKYLKINYEYFIQQPQKNMERILNLLKKKTAKLPFISDFKVNLDVSHSVYGNPNRFQKGIIRLRMDQRWNHMDALDKTLVTFLTWPLLVRYGYPLFPNCCAKRR